ncbi:hypothetical protein FOMPIDRAFT_1042713 [Fomitopsis schrenkii]|uniref:DUF6534 domain-containing protein n=1 Tax=Fomitopsis schrenkii TaxID=2126942 RepID=S8DXW0_FOMSC|nr:hypothetical protein FOMPIDRAFT_1042713 [Fomitopsis schrenkii]
MGTDLNKTVGALLIGTLLTTAGFGITTMQTYLWYRNYPRDPRMIRMVVWSLFALDVFHITLSMHVIYYYLILNYNNPPALQLSVWSFDATVAVTAVITCISHGFYARRVFILGNRNWFLPLIIAILSSMRLIFGCIVTGRMLEIKVLAELPHRIGPLVGIGMGAGSLADWIITASLVFFLRRHRTGLDDTNNLLDKLTYWTVNNGLFTSIVGVCVIITLLAMPYNMIYLAFHLLLSKLYANALLATLNYRKAHRGRGIEETTRGHPTSSLRIAPMDTTQYSTQHSIKMPPIVHVMTDTVKDITATQNGDTPENDDAHDAQSTNDSKVYPDFGDSKSIADRA